MKPATLSELKSEMKRMTSDQLMEICLRMVKYRKENKELATYLLFEADDEKEYIKNIKEEMDQLFLEMNRDHIRYVIKSLRKILRYLNRYSKFSGKKQTEAEILLYFCRKIKQAGINYKRYTVLENIYNRQVVKIEKAVASLHEDLQYDYLKQLHTIDQ